VWDNSGLSVYTVKMNADNAPTGGKLKILKDVPLAQKTTIGIGGNAKYFMEAASAESLLGGIEWARNQDIPVLALGAGSNIIVADSGFGGLVIRVCIGGIRELVTQKGEDRVTLRVGAGVNWDDLVSWCVQKRYSGIECLSGIPGLVGATPIQNVGAYGQEVAEVISAVEAIDMDTGSHVEMKPDECGFGYRTSRFKASDKRRFIITRVDFDLTQGGAPAVRYAELAARLAAGVGRAPEPAQVRHAVLELRRSKSMVIDAADPDSKSVGSFFVNPVVSAAHLDEIRTITRSRGIQESLPVYPASEGRSKLSAAWLIEKAGYKRGHQSGNVGLSSKHALAIVNRGGGTAKEVLELALQIKRAVLQTFGVPLTAEPVFIGFDDQSGHPLEPPDSNQEPV
jgi:UDP-N-acetylmuramate dehydrogenase